MLLADFYNDDIRHIFPDGGVETFIKGFEDGSAKTALFNSPNGIDIDKDRTLFIADRNNHSIRRVTQSIIDGDVVVNVYTIAGNGAPELRDGPANQALFNKPRGLAIDSEGNIYVADFENNSIRKISKEGMVSTIINGLGGNGFIDGVGIVDHPSGEPEAKIDGPNNLYVNDEGTIFFADQGNHAVRRITFE